LIIFILAFRLKFWEESWSIECGVGLEGKKGRWDPFWRLVSSSEYPGI